jgi:hypothetical protein
MTSPTAVERAKELAQNIHNETDVDWILTLILEYTAALSPPADMSQKDQKCDVSDEEIQHACDKWLQTRECRMTEAAFVQVVWGAATRWMRERMSGKKK